MSNPKVDATIEEQIAEHYRALGRVAVEWTRFEDYLGDMVQMLAGVDDEFGQCLTAQIGTADRMLDAFLSLSELRRPGISRDPSFRKRLEHIRSVADRQRHAIHDLWTFDPGVTSRWPKASGGATPRGPVPTPTSDIEALALEIEGLSDEFLDFRREFLMSLGLWPGQ